MRVIQLKREIQQLMKSNCLVSMDIVFNSPKTIPRSDGKAIRVVDLRTNNTIGV
jgi:phenylacetate-CoA ligase